MATSSRGMRGQAGHDLTRRDFLGKGALSAAGLALANGRAPAATAGHATHCIVLFLVGGPSQVETWDPKSDAPSDVRGPFRPIRTCVPGILIGEHFPRMAAMADRYAIVRSVYHDSAPIHETGQQLLQTGWLSRGGQEHPHCGAALSYLQGRRADAPAFVVMPGPIGNTGVSISHGQGAGCLGTAHEPVSVDALAARAPDGLAAAYGASRFGQLCRQARQLVERGVRLVTVNMFETVFGQTTWDCHADGGALATTLDDYRRVLCPAFDQAYTALLDDLHQRGLLETTLVVAMGEFGRTPRLNARGGRDHWPGCWSVLFAGGGVRGGQVVGASDPIGAEPANRPVPAAEVAATIYHALGIDPATQVPGPDGEPVPLVEAAPIRELFGRA